MMQALISPQHADFTLLLPQSPTMEEVVQVPLYGRGIVCGLNPNYQGGGETWVRLAFSDGRESNLPYIIG